MAARKKKSPARKKTAARRTVKKGTARLKATITELPKRIRSALDKTGAKVAPRKRGRS